jgi:glucan phosphoethanolaminetransferase (alkaline phosphatase superfamily)
MYLQSEDYLLPCLNKKLFGVDCPGCGIQRSIVHVAKGEFTDAFYMYPAIYTLLIFAIFLLLNWKFKFKNARKIIIILASINLLIILISYIIKMNQLI